MAELKNCPFCGGSPKIMDDTNLVYGKSKGGRWKYVQCQKCFAQSGRFFWDDKKDMIEAWNRRAES